MDKFWTKGAADNSEVDPPQVEQQAEDTTHKDHMSQGSAAAMEAKSKQ